MRSDGVPSRGIGSGLNALYAALAIVAIAYWLILGHGHSWVFAALMLAAIRNHRNRRLGRTSVTTWSAAAHPRVRRTLSQRDPTTEASRPVRAPPRRVSGPNRPARHGREARS